jgi:hypothetical protein
VGQFLPKLKAVMWSFSRVVGRWREYGPGPSLATLASQGELIEQSRKEQQIATAKNAGDNGNVASCRDKEPFLSDGDLSWSTLTQPADSSNSRKPDLGIRTRIQILQDFRGKSSQLSS